MTFTFSSVGLDVKPASEMAQETTGFDLMPEHTNQMILSDMKWFDTAVEKPEEGSASAKFTLEFTMVGDKFNGRKVWNDYWVKKKDGTGNRIAQIQMNEIADAIGFVGELNNPFDMMTVKQPFQGTIFIEKNSNPQYKDNNRMKNPKKIGVAQPAQATQGFSAPAQQPSGFAPQQQPAANPFPQGQQQTQQGGMPDWSQQR